MKLIIKVYILILNCFLFQTILIGQNEIEEYKALKINFIKNLNFNSDDNFIPNTEFEYGDINNDGKEDIIVLLNICEGFEKFAFEWYFIAVFINTSDSYQLADEHIIVGNKYEDYELQSVLLNNIENGKINLTILRSTEDDPTCCPSIKENKQLQISNTSLFDSDHLINIKTLDLKKENIIFQFIGDTVNIEGVIYRVDGIEYRKSVGNTFSKVTADGIFLIVDLTLLNLNKSEFSIHPNFIKLHDLEGYEYGKSDEGTASLLMIDKTPVSYLVNFPPKIKKRVSIAFEVPDKAKAYFLFFENNEISKRRTILLDFLPQ